MGTQILALATMLGLSSATALAAPADLDPSFSQDGKVLLDRGGDEVANALAVQPNGKIVVAGSTSAGGDAVVSRLNPNGSLDTSFYQVGSRPINAGGFEHAYAVALQPDGKIVVAGDTGVNADALVVRLQPNGLLDASFGVGGMQVINTGGTEVARAVALQPDGKILVGGQTSVNFNAVVYRLNSNGVLDTSFGNHGEVAIDRGGGETLYGVAVQPDGKIVAAGQTSVNGNAVVYRLNAFGTPDTSFGSNGTVELDSEGTERLRALALQPDGKIVVAGDTDVNANAVVYRLNPNGPRDTSFDVDGAFAIDSGGAEIGNALALQSNGKIVVAGTTSVNGTAAVFRVNPSGGLDNSFDDDGAFGLDFGGSERGNAVALQPDGRIVVAGDTSLNGDALAFRLEGDPVASGTLPPTTVPVGQRECGGRQATAVGTAARNVIRGTRLKDVIGAFEGNDRIRGGRGNDALCGGQGSDRISGEQGNDLLLGEAGNDRLGGGKGNDRVSGGSGRDRIDVRGGGRDKVNCGSGFDRVKADRSDRVSASCERVSRGR